MGKAKLVGAVLFVVVLVGVIVILIVAASSGKGVASPSDTISNAPIGCPESTSIVVKSDEAGTQNITTSNSNFIRVSDDRALIVFSNYTLNTESIYSDITGDKVLSVVKISNQLNGGEILTGTYRKNSLEGDDKPILYSSEYNISTEDLAGGVFDDTATVELNYLGTDYACGTIKSQDSSSGINGKFIAKYTDRR